MIKITKTESYEILIKHHELVKLLREAGYNIPDDADFSISDMISRPPSPLVVTWQTKTDQE